LERYLRAASLVRAHSPALQERLAPYNPNVALAGSPLYWDLLADLPPPPRRPAPLKIVYMTGRVYDILAAIFLPDLRRILDEYGAQVELHCWGYHPPELRGHPRVRLMNLVTDYDQHLRRFYQQGYDIGLAPLLDDVFHRSKTDTKFREYGACRVAGVYSNGAVYAAAVQDGATGLLVPNTPGAWRAAVARLIDDASLRERIQAQAQEYVRQHYDPADFHAGWRRHLQAALAQPPRPAVLPSAPIQPARGGWGARASRLLERARRQGLASAWVTLRWYRHNLRTLAKVRRATARPAPNDERAR
jgi:glycosyltransferase involved in cell wall biosynthesis